MKKQRLSEQFKQDAVRLTGQGSVLREVEQSLGFGVSTLDKWVPAARVALQGFRHLVLSKSGYAN